MAWSLVAILVGSAFGIWHYRVQIVRKISELTTNPAAVSDTDHSRGDVTAAVTLVEYSDMECVECRRLHGVLRGLEKQYKFRWVFRHFPLETGTSTEALAVASECAAKQGKFWEFVDATYAGVANGVTDPVERVAEVSGVDFKRVRECMSDGDALRKVRAARAEGERIGVVGTPTVYVNGKRLRGSASAGKLIAILGQRQD